MDKSAEWREALKSADWNLFSSYAAMLTLATTTIYAGSFSSITKKSKSAQQDEDEEVTERVSSEDAKLFPFIASGALLGLYLVIRYLGKEWVNWILGWYFLIMGVGSVWKTSISFARFLLGTERWKKFDSWTISVKKGPKEDVFSVSWRTPALFLFPLSVLPSLFGKWYSGRWSFLINNIIGLSFCQNTMSMLKIDTFNTGTILLGGLFFYDIWWVFGTKVMVEVATTLDVPIKLLWPKSIYFSGARGYTLLGLGDIIIPGIFVALALRYDYSRSRLEQKTEVDSPPTKSFPKPYFYATLIAYTAGLGTTMVVMHVFRVAQPALLYLSPACILSLVGTAVSRGELREVWKWSDEPKRDEGGTKGTDMKDDRPDQMTTDDK